MPYVVCAEEIDGRWIAHVPDLPGCFASHTERETAISSIPKAVETYLEWCSGHGLRVSGFSGPMMVSEVVRAWRYEDDYEVNAFFAADRPPLLADEMPEYERLLLATRQELEQVLDGLSEDDLHKELSGEEWPIVGILNHVALAEQWYFDRMGIALPTRELPTDPLDRLVKVRDHTLTNLPNLATRIGVVALSGETWSARKVMRRTLWHERDHTDHIAKLKLRLR
jgi:predicted RNase H-like HicB family nuclease/uncharacterized damage-inducible protein DinB